ARRSFPKTGSSGGTGKKSDENASPSLSGGDAQGLNDTGSSYQFGFDAEEDVVKPYLYFPLVGVPRLVWISSSSARSLDFGPYLRAEPPAELKRTYMVTRPVENYTLIYLKQTTAVQDRSNEFLTYMLGLLAGGLRRPWYGPVLVSFDRSGVLSCATVKSEAIDVVHHLHAVYDRVARDAALPCDPMAPNPNVAFISAREFVTVFGGDMRAAMAHLG
ncbi:hypothetical protein VNI00_013396, partial [Paramarasmius palmivorus]